MAEKLHDPTEEGVGGLRGINRGLSSTDNHDIVNSFRQQEQEVLGNAVRENIGFVGVGDSSYDEDIHFTSQLEDLENARGELQPWYHQIGAGIAKAGVLAGTTMADGIMGTVIGIGNAAATGTFSGFWDNPFSNYMQQINEWSEEALPNYYTNKEKGGPWYDNIFTANFIGDKVLKNLGFAVGAAYSGKVNAGVVSKLMGLNKARKAFKGAVLANETITPEMIVKGYKAGDTVIDGINLTEDLARSAQRLKAASPILKLTGGITGALGEGRIEAINNSNDWEKVEIDNINTYKNSIAQEEAQRMILERPEYFTIITDNEGNQIPQLTPEGSIELDKKVKSKFDYDEALAKVAEDKAKMGNIDFALNIPLLTVSDIWQFGKFYAGGYNTARKSSSVIKGASKEMPYSVKKPPLVTKVGRALQTGIAEGPVEEMGQATISEAAGTYYASKLNDFYGAKIDPEAERETIDFMKSMGQAMLKTYGNVEGWEEGFIGALTGIVGIPGFRNIRSEEGSIQSPIYLQGGMREELREMREDYERDSKLVDALNRRVTSPEFLNYYQGTIRHNAFQRQMDKAVAEGDNFSFKNAEHSQLINDVMLFDKAGRIQDLYDIVEEAGTVKPEDVEELRSITVNKETGKSLYDGMTDKEVIEHVNKQAEETLNTIDNYREISDNLRIRLGDSVSNDVLEELTWQVSTIDNLEDRFMSLTNKVREALSFAISIPKEITDLSNEDLSRLLNSDLGEPFINTLNKVLDESNIPYKDDIKENIQDLKKIYNTRNDIINTYNGYIANPEKLEEKQAEQREEVLSKDKQEQDNAVVENINNSTNFEEIEKALSGNPIEERTTLIDSAESPIVSEYKEAVREKSDVLREINNSPLPQFVKDAASTLYNDAFLRAKSTSDIPSLINPEILINPDLDETKNTRLITEATALLQDTLNKAHTSKKEVSGIEVPEKEENGSDKPEIAKNKVIAPKPSEVPTAGKDSTPIIPAVNKVSQASQERAVGDITKEDLLSENKTQEGFREEPRGRKYYAPVIPDIHIEARKEGDFRPFDVVVKEKEGLDFSEIYTYLRENGGFSYVNEGGLREGVELGFMIDPSFNDKTIFIIRRDNNQVVGSLAESDFVVQRYEGLKELMDRIYAEYNSSKKEGKFIATPTTRVSRVIEGVIPYDNVERNLNDIPKVDGNVIFGIARNGSITTNGAISNNLLIKPSDLIYKQGRLYMFIRNASGKYTPVAIRVKHFNSEEFNPEDVTISSTPVWESIQRGIHSMAKVTNEEELTKSLKSLSESLYIGGLHIDWVDSEGGTGIRLTMPQRDENGNEIYDEVEGKRIRRETSKIVFITSNTPVLFEIGAGGAMNKIPKEFKDIQVVEREIIDALMSFNLPLQVSANRINNPEYNSSLISSGILTSNITEASVKGAWFTIDYFDERGELKGAEYTIKTPVNGKETAIEGTEITYKGNIFYVDRSSLIIRDSLGHIERPTRTKTSIIMALAYIAENPDGLIRKDNLVLLPGGEIFDTDKEAFSRSNKVLAFRKEIADKVSDPHSIVSLRDRIYEARGIKEGNTVTINTGAETLTITLPESPTIVKLIKDTFINPSNVSKPENISDIDYTTLMDNISSIKQYVLTNDGEIMDGIIVYDQNNKAIPIDLIGITRDNKPVLYTIQSEGNPKTMEQLKEASTMFKNMFGVTPDIAIMDISSVKGKLQPIKFIKNAPINPTNNLPIFTSQDTFNPINRVSEETITPDGKIGYYLVGDTLYKGYLSPLGEIAGKPIYVTKVPKMTKGLSGGEPYVAWIDYLAVFPNGETFMIAPQRMPGEELNDIKGIIKKSLSKNPSKVIEMSERKTIIYNGESIPERKKSGAEIISPKNSVISSTRGVLEEINEIDNEFEDDLKLMEATEASQETFDKEREIAWLGRVLPQIKDKVLFAEGLIEAAKKGAKAWGTYSRGIITLSNQAAKGATYHEAFHAVFDMISTSEKEVLLKEAEDKWGDMDNTDLEERLAEGFREYMIREETFTGRILNFFKSLLAKVTHWDMFMPYSYSYYHRINRGSFSNELSPISSTRENSLDFSSLGEIVSLLEKNGWDRAMWDKISVREREQVLRCIS